jgi:hypothetical protein
MASSYHYVLGCTAAINACCVTPCIVPNFIEHCASIITEFEKFLFEERIEPRRHKNTKFHEECLLYVAEFILTKAECPYEFKNYSLIALIATGKDTAKTHDSNYRTMNEMHIRFAQCKLCNVSSIRSNVDGS